MKSQPNRNYISNDDVQTPIHLAERIVRHFHPTGSILEPCKGNGNFLRFLPHAHWCEIKDDKDFFQWTQKVDWIITNPPWSQIRAFLKHSMLLADKIVFLMTVNHVWTKARIRDVQANGFGIREICLVEMPDTFPQSGFQLGAIKFERDWRGDIAFSDISAQAGPKRSLKIANSLSKAAREPSADLLEGIF